VTGLAGDYSFALRQRRIGKKGDTIEQSNGEWEKHAEEHPLGKGIAHRQA
jgi:hypothetical protein